MMFRFFSTLLRACLLLISAVSIGYEIETHAKITNYAYSASQLE